MLFEDWSAEELQSDKWDIFEVAGPEGPYRFEEPAVEVDFEAGKIVVRVNPFTRKADTSPFDDFKHFVVSRESVPVPESGVLTVEAEIAVRCWNNDPWLLRDAMAGLFLTNPGSGLVFGAVSNGTLAGAACARLALPGTVAEAEAFAAVAEAWDRLSPDEAYKYTLQYERNVDKVTFWLGEKLFYAVRHVPVKLDQMHLGLALVTLGRASQPLHDQGAELRVGPIDVIAT
jgi:hypothetical protein